MPKHKRTRTRTSGATLAYTPELLSRSTRRRSSRVIARPTGPRPENPSFIARAGRAAVGFGVGSWSAAIPAAAIANAPYGALAAPAVVGASALYGAYRGFNSLSQTKMKDTKRVAGVGTLGYQRSSMKVKGKKAPLKHQKHVKVSKYLKAAIKEVSKSATASGYYTRIFTGCVGSALGNATDFLVNHSTGVCAGQTAIMGPTFNYPAGNRSLFNGLAVFKTGTTALVNGADLNFFSPAKILHAASVMFNGKAENVDPTLVPGNLATIFNKTTGLTASLDPGNLKIDVSKSWVHFSLKNISNRVVVIDIWELGSNMKFQQLNALYDLNLSQTAALDTTTLNQAVLYNTGVGPSGLSGGIIFEGNINPVSLFQRNGYQWKGKHREMTLQPDETCVHSIAGPSGVLDYAKLTNNGLDQTFTLFKGFSVSCIISVRGDQVIRTGTAAVSQGQRDAYSDGVNTGVMGMPVAIEMSENYMIKVPEVAGFLAPPTTGIPGTAYQQNLSFRKNKRVVSNFIPPNGSSLVVNNTVTVSNPTNPLLDVSGGGQTN